MTAKLDDRNALVLLSGGQDSAVALAWALDRFDRVETIGFDYGQRHRVELEARQNVRSGVSEIRTAWRDRLGADHLVALPALSDIPSAMTGDAPIVAPLAGLPNTFLPGRNLIFFVYAAALAYGRDLKHLVGGMCETDFSGYPDCRNETLMALQATLGLGMDAPFVIDTPLMWIDKRATWQLAQTLGGQALVDLILEETHTCYTGARNKRHAWGYGCGECPACELRAKGYFAWVKESGS